MDIITQFAQAITAFIAGFFLKGSEKMGEKAGDEVYNKVKNIFSKEKQERLLNDLENEPDSMATLQEVEKELVAKLKESPIFPPEIKDLLNSLNEDAPKLTILYEAYRALERQYAFKVEEIADVRSNASIRPGGDLRKSLKLINKKQTVIAGEWRRILNQKKRK
jgi:hypothetical protein